MSLKIDKFLMEISFDKFSELNEVINLCSEYNVGGIIMDKETTGE